MFLVYQNLWRTFSALQVLFGIFLLTWGVKWRSLWNSSQNFKFRVFYLKYIFLFVEMFAGEQLKKTQNSRFWKWRLTELKRASADSVIKCLEDFENMEGFSKPFCSSISRSLHIHVNTSSFFYRRKYSL